MFLISRAGKITGPKFYYFLVETYRKIKELKNRLAAGFAGIFIKTPKGVIDIFNLKELQEKIVFSYCSAKHQVTIAITVTESHPMTTCGDYFTATGLGKALEKIGYRVIYLPRRPENRWYDIPDETDILLILFEDYRMDKINSRNDILKTAWVRNRIESWCKSGLLKYYHAVMTSSCTSLEALMPYLNSDQYRGVMRLAADTDRFHGTLFDKKYKSDICFVGNIFHFPRDIAENLCVNKNMIFRFWGRLESPGHPFAPFHEGTAPYKIVPGIYNSAKIVLEDCMKIYKPYGCINSRTFEAMACGACVVSNNVRELKEIFPEEILVYNNKKELDDILAFYLENNDKRHAIGMRAKEAILAKHTYRHRAVEFRSHLSACVNRSFT